MADRDPDLLVIGGGTAGIVGATSAASAGARVVLVERAATGGECLWTGCVPSKALLAAAAAAAAARGASRFGVDVASVSVDGERVLEHVRAAVAAIAPVDSPEALRAQGVRVLSGTARLVGRRGRRLVVDVDGEHLVAGQVLLATGAAPLVPDVPGLREPGASRVLTSETLWDGPELPAELVVLGGGGVGCEVSQALARLGSRVVLVERGERLLSGEDPQAGGAVAAALRADGVQVLLGTEAAELRDGHLLLRPGPAAGRGVQRVPGSVPAPALLVAAGRAPRSAGLGLDGLGVALEQSGAVVVDALGRTTAPGLWAAGDVTGPPFWTHTAGVDASVAALNAVLGLRRRRATTVPRVVFTDPEVAAVGPATAADQPGTRTVGHGHVDRAVADGRTEGFVRTRVDRRGRVVAVTAVGPRAGEVLAEGALAVDRGLRLASLFSTTHAYPTYADGFWNGAVDAARESLGSPAARRALALGVGLRRRWLQR